MRSRRIFSTFVLVALLASQFFLITDQAPFVNPAFACYSWQVGARVGLRGGSEIRTGSGLNYQVHTIVPEDNWQVDIIGGPRNADGKEWWDISRQNLDGGGTGWVYKEQAGYDLCNNNPPADPGKVELVDNLSLSSDGSGQWPPMVGDKLVAHIKVRNSGGQALNLKNIGVRGRKNGGEYWDIGWWQANLEPGQVWELNPNNERPLEAGNYSFRISYEDNSGWHEIENEINFSVSAPAPEPGQIKLIDNLTLQSGSGQWPPSIGDKLVAHIKVRNNGGQTLNLKNIGVRGRKNGGEYWDIGWWQVNLESGQVWELNPNNERPLEAGNYSFRISYEDNSGWHEIGNEINFSVNAPPQQPQPDPGQVKLVDNLTLWSDGSGQWPPVVGDKLVAHIKVRNSGGQELNLKKIGVRGRKNGSENWDIGWWSAELESGQVWVLDPNNERPLEAGNYSFRISYKDDSGWHEIGNEIDFSVGESPAASDDVQATEAPVAPAPNEPQEPNALSNGQWQVGKRVGLCAGIPIRSGNGFSYPVRSTVPENGWVVEIIGGPRNADGVTWWNISRANIDGGSTGWIIFEQTILAQCTTLPSTLPLDETIPLPPDGPSSDPCQFPVSCVEAAVNTDCDPQCVATARNKRPDLVLWSGSGTSDQILAAAEAQPKFMYQGQQQQVRVRSKGESPQDGDLVIWPWGCGGAWSPENKPGGHIGFVDSGDPFRISDSNWGNPISKGVCATRTNEEIPIKPCMKFITSPYPATTVTAQKPTTSDDIQQPVDKCSQFNGLRWLWCKITGH